MDRLDRNVSQTIAILAQVVAGICQRGTLDEAAGGSLSRNQFTILRVLSSQREFTVGGLAGLLGISNAATSKNIDRLVQLGLVVRCSAPGDRRRQTISLQSAGNEILARYDHLMAQRQTKLLGHFTVAEKEQLLDLLRRVIQCTLADDLDTDVVCIQCAGECGDECVLRHGGAVSSARSPADPDPGPGAIRSTTLEVGNHDQPS